MMNPIESSRKIENRALSVIQTQEYNVKSQVVRAVCFANTSSTTISYHQNAVFI